jgi:dihydrofolate reductase
MLVLGEGFAVSLPFSVFRLVTAIPRSPGDQSGFPAGLTSIAEWAPSVRKQRSTSQTMTVAFIGYAIVSADGFIADANGRMPEVLCFEADWAYFRAAIRQTDLMILGRHTHELSPNLTNRPRLVASRGVRAVIQENASTWWANPKEMTPSSAVAVAVGTDATVMVAGGSGVYGWVLGEDGYDEFHLSIARQVVLGTGRPLLDEIDGLKEIVSVFKAKGLCLEEQSWLDEDAEVELLRFRRIGDVSSDVDSGNQG